ncbi:MAG: ABC transporter ATP-binding protein [Oscillospiraceae bacterium]|jgi:ABC-2 type transport system ATP-binding protein|nr:ABC transporter ATP-binding protein [Oscillospiraceae bacterium]
MSDMRTTSPILEARSVTRKYGTKVALNNLDLTVNEPGVVGLLGRNGAGKSTLLRILMGQDLPTSGEARLFGERPFDNAAVLSRVCMALDHPEYGSLRTVSDLLEVSASIYSRWDAAQAKRLIDRFELDTKKKLKALSRGMQTSLALLIGLSSCAELTLFDEPSLGLDAVMRERFYDLLIEAKRSQPERCFVVSTHLIEEVARTLDSVRMIEDGRLLAQGGVDELTKDAYMLTGAGAEKPEYAELMKREDYNGLTTLYLRGKRPDQLPPGATITPISLQRLFVLMTDKELDA